MNHSRRDREDEEARIDEREDPDPERTLAIDAAVARADEPARISPQCMAPYCARWQPCPKCEEHRIWGES